MYNSVVIFVYASSGSALIISGPGVVKKETAKTADFRWNLTEPFNAGYFLSIFLIYKGHPDTGPLVLQFLGGSTGGTCSTFVDPSLDCITDGQQIGFNITAISDNNASVYSLSVDLDVSVAPTYEYNSDSLLYIYSKYHTYKIKYLFTIIIT